MDDDEKPVSKSAAAKALNRNRGSVASALTGVEPDAPPDRTKAPRWRLGTVRAALAAHDARVDAQRLSNTNASGGGGDDGGDHSEFRQHRAEYMRQRAIAATRANEVEAGKWISAQDVLDMISVAMATVYAQMCSRHNRLAVRAAGKGAQEVSAILWDDMVEMLENIQTARWHGPPISGTMQFQTNDGGVETRTVTLADHGLTVDGHGELVVAAGPAGSHRQRRGPGRRQNGQESPQG